MYNQAYPQHPQYPQHQPAPIQGERVYDLNNLRDVNEIFQMFANASQAGRPQNFKRW